MASRARLVALLIGLATAAASGGFGGSEPAVERRSCARAGGAAAPTAAECGRCHAEIHAEWQDSAHGEAFTDPAWQAALARTRRPELCWPCHAPEPVHRRLGRMPAVRATHREEGVTCLSCHDDGGRIAGPFGAETDAHATVAHPAFSEGGSVALCGSCHDTRIGPVLPLVRDFVAARLAERGKSCIGCHMPRATRAIAVDPVTGRPAGPERRGRSHALRGPSDPEFAASAFRVDVRRAAEAVELAIGNRAGHRVPGLVGRRFPFRLRVVSDGGETLAEHTVTISAENWLAVRETRRFRFPVPPAAAAVELTVEHRLHDDSRPILAKRFPL